MYVVSKNKKIKPKRQKKRNAEIYNTPPNSDIAKYKRKITKFIPQRKRWQKRRKWPPSLKIQDRKITESETEITNKLLKFIPTNVISGLNYLFYAVSKGIINNPHVEQISY